MLAALLGPASSVTGAEGAMLGSLMAFAVVLRAMGMTTLFEHRPAGLILINASYHSR